MFYKGKIGFVFYYTFFYIGLKTVIDDFTLSIYIYHSNFLYI